MNCSKREEDKRSGRILKKVVFSLYLLCALFAATHAFILEKQSNPDGVPEKMKYGNYVQFKLSWFHLVSGKDLYVINPAEHYDYFKYSPTFAVIFGIIAWMPDLPGLLLWTLLNTLLLLFAVRSLPGISDRNRSFLLLFLLVEMMTSIQNMQSNALMAGLLIFAFVFLEQRKPILATLFIVLTIYIKLFGIVALLLFLLYPQKGKLVLWTIAWFLILFLLPLPLTGVEYLKSLYLSWFRLLSMDHSASLGFSVMGWLSTWFGLPVAKDLIPGLGAVVCCLPMLMIKKYRNLDFRLLMLASILVWMVIFNHKAESPTFIIAMSGVGIWFFSRKMTPLNITLVVIAFLFTSLTSTDLCPRSFHDNIVEPYAVKAVPCILIWFKIIWDLCRNPANTDPVSQESSS
jgi:hypothetical protein